MGLSRANPAASPKPSCLFPAEGLIMAFHCLPVPAIISWFLAKQWFTQHIKVSFHFCFQFPTFWCFPAISLPEDILPFFFPFNLLLHSIYRHLSTPPLPFMLLELSCAAEFRGCSSLHLILGSWRFFSFIVEFKVSHITFCMEKTLQQKTFFWCMVLAVQKNTKNSSALQDLFYEASCPAMKAGAGDHKEQYTHFFPFSALF